MLYCIVILARSFPPVKYPKSLKLDFKNSSRMMYIAKVNRKMFTGGKIPYFIFYSRVKN